MYKIALVTYNSPPYLSESDKILSDTFKKYGLETNIISWDDTKVQWEQFSVVILRSCWDYHYRIREFLQWLDRLENLHVNVLNPLSIIR
ncbi:MAG TPA: hypothetical protein VK338_02195, partial [Candidatus Nitrosocosmicus sp.]|nr:hypothetical protein [Candidatus Nitrosocosmicus sp.]